MFARFFVSSETKLRPRRGSHELGLNQGSINYGYKGDGWNFNGGYNWQNKGWGVGIGFELKKRNQILAPYSDQNKTVSETGWVNTMSNLVPFKTLQ